MQAEVRRFEEFKSRMTRWFQAKMREYRRLQAHPSTRLTTVGDAKRFFLSGPNTPLVPEPPLEENRNRLRESNIVANNWMYHAPFVQAVETFGRLHVIVTFDLYADDVETGVHLYEPGNDSGSIELYNEWGRIGWENPVISSHLYTDHEVAWGMGIVPHFFPQVNVAPSTAVTNAEIQALHEIIYGRSQPQKARKLRGIKPLVRSDPRNRPPKNRTSVISLNNVPLKNAYYLKPNVVNHKITALYGYDELLEALRHKGVSPKSRRAISWKSNVYKVHPKRSTNLSSTLQNQKRRMNSLKKTLAHTVMQQELMRRAKEAAAVAAKKKAMTPKKRKRTNA